MKSNEQNDVYRTNESSSTDNDIETNEYVYQKISESIGCFTSQKRSDKKQMFIKNREVFTKKMIQMYDLIFETFDMEPYDPASNKLKKENIDASRTKEIKPFFYIKELDRAWLFLAEYCGDPGLQPILPCVIFTVLCNYPCDDISSILNKTSLDGNDKETLYNNLFTPHVVRRLTPNKDVKQWSQAKKKIYDLFYVVMGFYIIMSLPICKKSDIKLCLEWADITMPILLDVFMKLEKPEVIYSNSANTLNLLGMNNDITQLKEQKNEIDGYIDEIIDSIDFDSTWEANAQKIETFYKKITSFSNTLAYRLTIFEGNCVEKVIEPNQHAQFFFRLFKFNFLADAIIIEGTFDLCTLEERNSVKALYEKTFDGEECDYIDTPKMPCPI